MPKLFRGVCRELDEKNQGRLRPAGKNATLVLRRNHQLKGVRRDGKFSRGKSETNAARAHQYESGYGNSCFVSFTRSKEKAIQFATRDSYGEKTDGFVYEVDESMLKRYGVVSHKFENAEYPGEFEVTLRSKDCSDLPIEIVISKTNVSPDDYA